MLELILCVNNLPFTISLGIMLMIAMMEGVGLLFGVGFSNLLDSIFPDFDIDAEIPDDFQAPDFFTKILSWLRVGKVPILVLIIVLLTSFSVFGFLVQLISKKVFFNFLPAYLAAIPAIILSIPIVRFSAKTFEKLIPEDETEAISEKTFIGKVAKITLGNAKLGKPAEAKFIDEYRQTHYLMVEPDSKGIEFKQGAEVIIVSQQGSIFQAILNENSLLKN